MDQGVEGDVSTLIKTAVASGDAPGPNEFAYIALKLKSAGRSASTFTASMDNFVKAVDNARRAVGHIIEAYYFDREAEARWADDGGPCP